MKRSSPSIQEVSFQCFIFLILFILILSSAFADQSTSQKSVSAFSLESTLQTSSTLHELDDVNRQGETSLYLIPQYSVSELIQLSALFGINQEMTGEQKTSITNLTFGLREKGISLNPYFKYSLGGSALAPTHSDSRNRESLLSSVKFSPRLIFSPQQIPQLRVFYELGLSKNFHEFFTSTTGGSNVSYSLTQRIVSQYSLTDQLSASVDFARNSGWTYFDNIKTSFDLSEELSFEFIQNLSLAIGHSNGGGLLSSNGVDSNFAVFNENTSTVYTSITALF